MTDRFLRLPAVIEITGRSVATIYRDMQTGAFPGRIPLGGRCVAWLESEIREWMDDKVAKSRCALKVGGKFGGHPHSLANVEQ